MALNSQKNNWKELGNDWNKMLFFSGKKEARAAYDRLSQNVMCPPCYMTKYLGGWEQWKENKTEQVLMMIWWASKGNYL